MKSAASTESSANAAQSQRKRALGSLELCALTLLVPCAFREEFVGDLIEELRTSPRLVGLSPAAARRWIWHQITASTFAMLLCRLTQGGNMAKYRWGACALFVAIASLQAWDSHVLRSTAAVGALVGVAIALPAMAMLLAATTRTVYVVFGLTIALLLSAKFISPIPLPALGVIGVIALFLFLGCNALDRRGERQRPPDEPSPTT